MYHNFFIHSSLHSCTSYCKLCCNEHNSLGEKGGEGEMYGKRNMEASITICKIDSQWEFAVWRKKLKQGLCIILEGWDVEEEGSEVQKGEDICIPMANSC